MRLEKLENKLLVWETGCQNNKIQYDSTNELSSYRRRLLSDIELFLVHNGEIEEAIKINKYLGKIIRCQKIPQLIPTGTYKINSQLNYLKDSIERYIEEYGLDLNPDFQRAHVWTLEQRVAFVEFILQGGKTNPIYLNHTGWMKSMEGEMVIVDGKQRLTSILMFLNNEFPVFKNLDSEGVGYYEKDFNFIPSDIEIVINDLPTRKQVLQWYLQINRGNVAHTDEELDKVEELLNKEV